MICSKICILKYKLSLADKEVLPEPLLCLGVGSLNREQEAVQVLLPTASQPQRILRSLDGHWTVIGGHIAGQISHSHPPPSHRGSCGHWTAI